MSDVYRLSAVGSRSCIRLAAPYTKGQRHIGNADKTTDIWTGLHTIQDGIRESIVSKIGYEVLCPR